VSTYAEFKRHYESLPTEELLRIAATSDLVAEAASAMKSELAARRNEIEREKYEIHLEPPATDLTYPAEFVERFRIGVLVVIYWMTVLAIPFVMVMPVNWPDPLLLLLIAVLIGYFVFTGIRAWRRRWISRFVLRIVIPAGLLLCGSVIAGIIAWRTAR